MRIILLALLVSIVPAAAGAGTLEHVLQVPTDRLELVPVETGIRVVLPGYPASGRPGQPALPARVVRLALPADADPATVSFEIRDLAPPFEVPLPDGSIRNIPVPRWLCPDACGGDGRFHPGAGATGRLPGGRLGPVLIAEYLHLPAELHGQRIVIHSRQLLTVSFATRPASLPRTPRRFAAAATRLVDNPGDLARFYPVARDAGDPPGVAVVTPEWFAGQSQVLPDLMAAYEARGYAPLLVTEADFDAVDGPAPNERPQKLRTWLQQNHAGHNLEYLVLIGNPDPFYGDLPMLRACPYQPGELEYADETPTDAYFADLTGNWDLDQDGRYGEYEDDSGPGGVDFYAELKVGRIPVYGNVEVADALLRRAIAYAADRKDTGWRRRILFPGAILFFKNDHEIDSEHMEGGDVAERMEPGFREEGFEVFDMYEHEGLQPSYYLCDRYLTEENLIDEWKRGYGLIYWFGHGSEDAAYRTIWEVDLDGDDNPTDWELSGIPFMQSIRFERLPRERPSMVFHGSCSNGTPETAANIGYTLLKSGAIATYSSTRVALGATGRDWEPDPNFTDIFMAGYYVMTKLRDGKTTGEAIGETRAVLGDSFWGASGWHTKFGVVLYGDPTLSVTNCESDADCDDLLGCTGAETCVAGICQAGAPLDCSELDDACHQGACNEGTDSCEATPLDEHACDDGLFCTVHDTCRDGACRGTPRTCQTQAGPCVQGQCDEETRMCIADRLPDDTSCPLEGGTAGRCRAGVCRPAGGCGCASATAPPGLGFLLLATLILLRSRRS